jgi:hypothetical protein
MGHWRPASLNDEELDRQFLAGVAAEAAAAAVEPRASSVRYDTSRRTLVLQLRDGTFVAVPVSDCPALAGLEDEVIGAVRMTPSGYGLHWDSVDIHLAVPAVIGSARCRG